MYTATPFLTLPGDAELDMLEQQFEAILPTLIKVGIAAAVLFGIFLLLFYLLLSIAIYTMAERRGIGGAFCAWIPLARWVLLGRIASDIFRARTGKRAVYGTLIAATILVPIVMSLCAAIYDVPEWVLGIPAIIVWLSRVVRLFALGEVYRDYSRHAVGLLIFNVMFFWLTPIFMIAVHKHTPESVRRSYSAAHRRTSARVADSTSAGNEPAAEPEPAPLVTPAPQEPQAPPAEPQESASEDAPVPESAVDTAIDVPVDTQPDVPGDSEQGEGDGNS